MEACLALARVSHTPVPYWLSRPLVELNDWLQTAVKMNKKGGEPRRGS